MRADFGLCLFLTGVLDLLLIGCSDEVSSFDRTGRAALEQPVPLSAAVELLPSLRRQLSIPGARSTWVAREAANRYFAASDSVAMLADAYHHAADRSRPGLKRDLLFLAGLSARHDAVEFLLREALRRPVPLSERSNAVAHAPPELASAFAVAIDEDFANRLTAALSLVASSDRDEADADAALDELLSEAESEVAQIAAVELYGRGQLTERRRQLLADREIGTEFQRLSASQRAQLLRPDPGVRDPMNPVTESVANAPPAEDGASGAPVVETAPVVQRTPSMAGSESEASSDVIYLDTCSADTVALATDLLDSSYAGFCNQSLIDDAWGRFAMEQPAWMNFGYTDPCNTTLPLGRTFISLAVLAYAGSTTPDCSYEGDNVLLYAYCWAGNAIHELTPLCAGNSAASTIFGTLELDPRTELHESFFYAMDVPLRAATIFHEARHADAWCTHTNNCRAGAGGCDPTFIDGCVGAGSSSGTGAYAWSVSYLGWFAFAARPEMTNEAIRLQAVVAANTYLANHFERDPCFRLDSQGVAVSTC